MTFLHVVNWRLFKTLNQNFKYFFLDSDGFDAQRHVALPVLVRAPGRPNQNLLQCNNKKFSPPNINTGL